MKKNLLFIFILSFFLISSSYSFDFNNIYKVKTFSATNLEINDTNLVDQEHAENLVESIEDLNVALIKKGKEIKNNKLAID